MKKIFLAALTAFALCSYSYAQDDDFETDDDSARSVAEESYSAPATSSTPSESRSFLSTSDEAKHAMLGIGVDLVTILTENSINDLHIYFRPNNSMLISAIFGFWHHGETTVETKNKDEDKKDDYTQLALGAGFDFFFMRKVLPVSGGGEFILHRYGEDNYRFDMNFLAGFEVELVAGFYLTGKVGLDIGIISNTETVYVSDEDGEGFGHEGHDGPVTGDATRIDFGLKASLILAWYFL